MKPSRKRGPAGSKQVNIVLDSETILDLNDLTATGNTTRTAVITRLITQARDNLDRKAADDRTDSRTNTD